MEKLAVGLKRNIVITLERYIAHNLIEATRYASMRVSMPRVRAFPRYALKIGDQVKSSRIGFACTVKPEIAANMELRPPPLGRRRAESF